MGKDKKFYEDVKMLAEDLRQRRGIIATCERCFYIKNPTCPDFIHICDKDGKQYTGKEVNKCRK